MDNLLQNFTVERIAVDAALGVRRNGYQARDQQEEDENSCSTKHQGSLLVAQGLHGIKPGRTSSRIPA